MNSNQFNLHTIIQMNTDIYITMNRINKVGLNNVSHSYVD